MRAPDVDVERKNEYMQAAELAEFCLKSQAMLDENESEENSHEFSDFHLEQKTFNDGQDTEFSLFVYRNTAIDEAKERDDEIYDEFPQNTKGKEKEEEFEEESIRTTIVCVFVIKNIQNKLSFLNDFFYQDVSKTVELAVQSQKLDNEANNKIIFTGFSLAAGLAEIAAVYTHKKAITFESPGVKKILITLAEQEKKYEEYQNTDVITYLTVPNPVNTFGIHIGKIKRVYMQHVTSTTLTHRAKAVWGTAQRLAAAYGFYLLISRLYSMPSLNQELYAKEELIAFAQAQVGLSKDNVDQIERELQKIQGQGGLLSERLIAFANKLLETGKDRYHSNLEFLQNAQNALTKIKLDLTTTQQWLHYLIRGSLLLTLINMGIKSFEMSKSQKNIFTDRYCQHSLSRISNALKENNPNLVALSTREGYVTEIASWPTTLSKSWAIFFANTGKSYLPYQAYNAGIHNFSNENNYIEQNIIRMDGYRSG